MKESMGWVLLLCIVCGNANTARADWAALPWIIVAVIALVMWGRTAAREASERKADGLKADSHHCGGKLPDGSTCTASIWRPGYHTSPFWQCYAPGSRGPRFYSISANDSPGYCAVCGTRLGIDKDGNRTREVMVPEGEDPWYLRRVASSSCPPGCYAACDDPEACASDDSGETARECWRCFLIDYGPTDGQEWEKREDRS